MNIFQKFACHRSGAFTSGKKLWKNLWENYKQDRVSSSLPRSRFLDVTQHKVQQTGHCFGCRRLQTETNALKSSIKLASNLFFSCKCFLQERERTVRQSGFVSIVTMASPPLYGHLVSCCIIWSWEMCLFQTRWR